MFVEEYIFGSGGEYRQWRIDSIVEAGEGRYQHGAGGKTRLTWLIGYH